MSQKLKEVRELTMRISGGVSQSQGACLPGKFQSKRVIGDKVLEVGVKNRLYTPHLVSPFMNIIH